jgi:hypothetical protein
MLHQGYSEDNEDLRWVAEIVDCVTTHRSRWFEGPYGFVLKIVEVFRL